MSKFTGNIWWGWKNRGIAQEIENHKKGLPLVGIHWQKKGGKGRKSANSNTSLSSSSCLLPLFLGKPKEHRPKLVPIGGWQLPVSCPVWPLISSFVSQLCCLNSRILKKSNKTVCDLQKFAIYFSPVMYMSCWFPIGFSLYIFQHTSKWAKQDTANHCIVKHAPWSRSLTIN